MLEEIDTRATEEVHETPTPLRITLRELPETPSDTKEKIEELVTELIEESDVEPVGPTPLAKETSSIPAEKLPQWYLKALQDSGVTALLESSTGAWRSQRHAKPPETHFALSSQLTES